MPVSNRGGGGGGAPGGNGGNRAARGPVAPPVRTATPPPSFADETTATPVRRIDVDAADSDSPFRRGGGGGGVHRVTAAADAADALPCVEGIEVAEVAEEDEEAATGSGGDDEAEGGDGGCEGCVENIILRFPTEQVEELISCLISHLVEQGLSEREASERAADILDDPDAQLVMAKELHKPVLARLLADFYARHDRDALRGLDREVAAFTGRTRDLLAVLRRRYRLNESALDDLALRLGAVVDEESEWAAATAERSGTGYTSRSGSGGGAGGEAAAAAAAAAATRRFLVGFFSKHDQERVLEADSLLRAYDGCAAALRRDLCGRYAASRGALRDLARMKVERPGAPSTGRELWLAANARRAAGGSRGVAAAVDAVGLSSGFRRYALFWGVAAAALLVACAAQQSLALLLAAFAPEQGRWQSAGLVCCFVAGVFVVGSLLGHVRGVLAEWAGLTPAEYYGDADLSGADGGNPVPPHLRPVLPPCVRRTFLRLPTCAWVPRHAYMAAAQAALLVVPLVGGVVRTAAEGGSVFQFLGTVSEWSVAAATAGLLLLWVHGWANALALKASRLRAPRGGGGAWYANGGVLAEFGLDARSTGRSLLVLAAAAALLLVPFWVNTQTSSDMPLAWVLVCAAVVGGVLGLREMRAAGPAVARYTPLCAAGFVAAFAVLGVAGTAQTGAATVGVFACLMVASQGMFLVHEDKAEEVCFVFIIFRCNFFHFRTFLKLNCAQTRTAIECAAERMHSVSEEDVEINDATPLRPTKVWVFFSPCPHDNHNNNTKNQKKNIATPPSLRLHVARQGQRRRPRQQQDQQRLVAPRPRAPPHPLLLPVRRPFAPAPAAAPQPRAAPLAHRRSPCVGGDGVRAHGACAHGGLQPALLPCLPAAALRLHRRHVPRPARAPLARRRGRRRWCGGGVDSPGGPCAARVRRVVRAAGRGGPRASDEAVVRGLPAGLRRRLRGVVRRRPRRRRCRRRRLRRRLGVGPCRARRAVRGGRQPQRAGAGGRLGGRCAGAQPAGVVRVAAARGAVDGRPRRLVVERRGCGALRLRARRAGGGVRRCRSVAGGGAGRGGGCGAGVAQGDDRGARRGGRLRACAGGRGGGCGGGGVQRAGEQAAREEEGGEGGCGGGGQGGDGGGGRADGGGAGAQVCGVAVAGGVRACAAHGVRAAGCLWRHECCGLLLARCTRSEQK